MAEGSRIVIGRVVSLEGGRPVVAVPVGQPTREQALVKAARDYKANPTNTTIDALCTAALALD